MAAASVWDDPALTNALGDRIADDLRAMARDYDAAAHRSQQKHLGPSQIGSPCTRCLARHALGRSVQREFDDPWCRTIGTAVHAWLDAAALHHNTANDRARYYPELRIHPDEELLPSGGNCDLYDEDTRTVVDHKIVGAEPLRKYRLNGPGPQYRVQAHLYGLGYVRAGHTVDHVAVAFWQRGGRLSDLYVWTEPYDEDVARTALERWRTIRDQALAVGPAILPLLPADPACWDCGGRDVTPDELAPLPQPNPIQGGSS